MVPFAPSEEILALIDSYPQKPAALMIWGLKYFRLPEEFHQHLLEHVLRITGVRRILQGNPINDV